jgi:TolA-binding protein
MTKKSKYHLPVLWVVLFVVLANCSTKKDSFINRNYHAMSSKYNVLYNGNIAFEEAKQQLDDTYEDNFWERLPIEPMKIEEKAIALPGQPANDESEKTGFEKAEEKAVKTVQKHSMVIDEFERNSQIDEAYLLLGKSRYYLQRFVPALEAFTFGIENYPNANLYREMKIWKAKAHIRLQNERLAIETLNTVIRSPQVTDLEYESAHTAMAMAYTQIDSIDLVIDHLKKSTFFFEDRKQGARNLFILGQIYREQGKIDSSNMVFESLMYLNKIPRKYTVHAAIERAKNYSEADSTYLIAYTLQELIEDRDNRPYLDELYYQAGQLELLEGNEAMAEQYFERSVRHNQLKPYQKSLSYEALGNMYFDQTNFEVAGAYYDSVLQLPIDQNTRRVRRIIRKRESLNDVILYENIARNSDSILTIINMSQEERINYFRAHIEDLKSQYEAQKEQEDAQQANQGIGTFMGTSPSGPSDGSFYFYNSQVVGLGKQQFQIKFGNRPYGDFWLMGAGRVGNAPTIKEEISIATDTSQLFDLNYYTSRIPVEREVIDSIKYVRNDAYYNLGLIYKEPFKEYRIAVTDFELFLDNDPVENLVLPAKYHLYESYAEIDPQQSNKYREEIVNDYPDSRYAQIIENPEAYSSIADEEDSPHKIYKSAFVCYEESDYAYALQTVNEALERFKGHELEAKFELLKAYLLLNTEGQEAFEEKLNYVITNFPNTEESDHAEEAMKKWKEMNNKEQQN